MRERRPLPQGYRQGVVTAITVLLGFSLLFLRFWGFEAPGEWTRISVAATLLLCASIALQFVALWRSLQLADDDEREYARTLRWFLSSAATLLVSLMLAGLDHAGVLNGQ